jgi:hypothetical protein
LEKRAYNKHTTRKKAAGWKRELEQRGKRRWEEEKKRQEEEEQGKRSITRVKALKKKGAGGGDCNY